jgi:hypothetical protein
MALAPNQFKSALRLARRNMVANTKPIVIMMPQMAPMTKAVINQAVDTSHIVRLNEFSDLSQLDRRSPDVIRTIRILPLSAGSVQPHVATSAGASAGALGI